MKILNFFMAGAFLFIGVLQKVNAQNTDTLEEKLMQEFGRLLQKEPALIQTEILNAKDILLGVAERKRSWTDYKKATLLFLKNRSLASIPLLIAIVESKKLQNIRFGEEAQMILTLLTGKDLLANVRKEKMAVWWEREKEAIQIDYELMSPLELQTVVNALLNIHKKEVFQNSPLLQESPESIYHFFTRWKDSDCGRRDELLKTTLHASMVPFLLTEMDPSQQWSIIVALYELFERGDSRQMEEVLQNKDTFSLIRYYLLLAKWKFDGKLDAEKLIEIYQEEQEIVRRMSILIVLGFSQESSTTNVILNALNDSDPKISISAAWAAREQKLEEAVEPIAKILSRKCSYPESVPYLLMLGNIRTLKSQSTLANAIAFVLKNNAEDLILGYLLRAFSSATGRMFASGYNKTLSQKTAQSALDWWEKEGNALAIQAEELKARNHSIKKESNSRAEHKKKSFPQVSEENKKLSMQHYNMSNFAGYTKAIEYNPRNVNAYIHRGLLSQQKGDLSSALSDFEDGIALNPEYDRLYEMRGSVFFAKEDWDSALADFTRAIERNSKDSNFWQSRAFAFARKKSFVEALKDLEYAIQLRPTGQSGYVSQGIVYWEMGDFVRAKQSFEKALALNIEYAYTSFKVLLPRYYNDSLAQVLENWEKTLTLAPNLNPGMEEFMLEIFQKISSSGGPISLVWFGTTGSGSTREEAVLDTKIQAVKQSSYPLRKEKGFQENKAAIFEYLQENYQNYCVGNVLVNKEYDANTKTISLSIGVRQKKLTEDIREKFLKN